MPPVAATLKAEFPEVLDAVRLRNTGDPSSSITAIRPSGKMRLAFTDSNFSGMRYPAVAGRQMPTFAPSPGPNTIVITRAVAEKYFGKEDPIGKVLRFPDDHEH